MPSNAGAGRSVDGVEDAFSTIGNRVQEPQAAAEVPRSRDLLWGSMRLRDVRQEAREADFVFSTGALARDGAKIDQSSWQLDNYLKNPAVLYSHGRAPDSLPIGKVKDLGVRENELRGTIVYASEKANPLAERVWNSVLEETMRATSVGFFPHSIRFETENDEEYALLGDCELYEISNTPVGSDPDALRRMVERAHSQFNPPADERGGEPITQTKESEMDKLEEVRAALAAKTADAERLSRDLESERATVAALESRCATLETERSERQAKLNELTAEGVKRDLAELVGVKITADEVDGLADVAVADRELFDRQFEALKARPDMNIVRDEPVITPDPSPPQTDTAEAGKSVNLFAEAEKRLSKEA